MQVDSAVILVLFGVESHLASSLVGVLFGWHHEYTIHSRRPYTVSFAQADRPATWRFNIRHAEV
jgi:hypothetical protein